MSIGNNALHIYVVFFRNHIFQGLYVVMVAGAHAAWVIDGLHFSYHTDSTTNHVFWPLVIFLANFSLLIVASVTDPGVLTKQNIDTFSHAYSYDGVFYKPGNHCPTCSFVKPARSKHCSKYKYTCNKPYAKLIFINNNKFATCVFCDRSDVSFLSNLTSLVINICVYVHCASFQ